MQYEFDAFDRLRRVFFFDNLTSTEVTVGQYGYDALGRRLFRAADEDHDGTLETQVRYVLAGDRVIEERDGAGSLLREYVYGNYIDEPIWMRDFTVTIGGGSTTASATTGPATFESNEFIFG